MNQQMAEVYICRLELESEKINSCSQLLNLEKIFFFCLLIDMTLRKSWGQWQSTLKSRWTNCLKKWSKRCSIYGSLTWFSSICGTMINQWPLVRQTGPCPGKSPSWTLIIEEILIYGPHRVVSGSILNIHQLHGDYAQEVMWLWNTLPFKCN